MLRSRRGVWIVKRSWSIPYGTYTDRVAGDAVRVTDVDEPRRDADLRCEPAVGHAIPVGTEESERLHEDRRRTEVRRVDGCDEEGDVGSRDARIGERVDDVMSYRRLEREGNLVDVLDPSRAAWTVHEVHVVATTREGVGELVEVRHAARSLA